MRVLSLFDGMSCGQIALNALGKNIEAYYASEIDKHAIEVTQHHYPDTIQLGDVTELDCNQLPKIDLLLGGSPCQGFSCSGKMMAFNDPRSALFWHFVRVLEATKPKYFLLENVRMKQEWQDIITSVLKVPPKLINSNLVSAQHRKRLYWTNIPLKTPLHDRRIYWKDISDNYTENQTIAAQRGRYIRYGNTKIIKQFIEFRYDGKSNCLTTVGKDVIVVPYSLPKRILAKGFPYRHLTLAESCRLQTVPVNWFDGITTKVQARKMLGNGWTIEVIKHLLQNVS